MKAIKIPGPQITSHMEGLMAMSEQVDVLESAVRKFFGFQICTYFQGDFKFLKAGEILTAAQTLDQGRWTLVSLNDDLKNVVFIIVDGTLKIQCNFRTTLAQEPLLNLTGLKKVNPRLVYKVSKSRRTLELFLNTNATRDVNYEC